MKIESIVSKEPWRNVDGVRYPVYVATLIIPVSEFKLAIDRDGADKVAVELFNIIVKEAQALEGEEIGRG